jgi:tetratricopeptide (TPR) repeat protein
VPTSRQSPRRSSKPSVAVKQVTRRATKSRRAKQPQVPRAAASATPLDYSKVCFVIMPFGKKPVGKHKVDFDAIYDDIFKPAINAVDLPEGGKLVARRTDRDFFTGDIGQEMFQFLQWSRLALADITSLNANVMYEVGVRHAARESGMAIFRQGEASIPFDISHIKAFPYQYRPKEHAAAARALIRRVLTESLQQNRLDSPVQIALRAQREVPDLEPLLLEVESLTRQFNRPAAIAKLREALTLASGNAQLHQQLGVLLRDQGSAREALEQFEAAVKLHPSYAEPWRERGIILGRIDKSNPEGESSLRRAIELNPNDFDALASLGGLLRRAGRFDDALAFYNRAVAVSGGHPYPLLMALKLQARAKHTLTLSDDQLRQLRQAEFMRRGQAETNPPFDAPWCFFDMAEIRLYADDAAGFQKWVGDGLMRCQVRWQAETFRSALQLLVDGGVKPAGLDAGIAAIDAAIPKLPSERAAT